MMSFPLTTTITILLLIILFDGTKFRRKMYTIPIAHNMTYMYIMPLKFFILLLLLTTTTTTTTSIIIIIIIIIIITSRDDACNISRLTYGVCRVEE